jgi:hypothetical protein
MSSGATLASPRRSRAPGAGVPFAWLALFAWLGLVVFACFGSPPEYAFFGDDLVQVTRYRADTWQEALIDAFTTEGQGKYRPLYNLASHAMVANFGSDHGAYLRANLGVHWLNCGLFALLVYQLVGARWQVIAVFSTLFAASRFALYQTWTTVGMLEGLALTGVLFMLLAMARTERTSSHGWLFAAAAGYWLSIFGHERFIALTPAVILWQLTLPAGVFPARQRAASAAAVVAGFLVNICVKVFYLQASFLVGSGGGNGPGPAPIDLAIGPKVAFFFKGLLTLLGLNQGPAYLSALDYSLLNGSASIWPAGFAGVCVAVVLGAAWQSRGGVDASARRRVVVYGMLLGLALLAASVTIRQEYRWLYVPYALFLAGLARCAAVLVERSPRPAAAALLALLGFGLGTEWTYRNHDRNLWFVYSASTAHAVLRDIVIPLRSDTEADGIAILTADPVLCSFLLIRGDFFRVYLPGWKIKFACGGDDVVLPVAREAANPRIFRHDTAGRFVPLPPDYPQRAGQRAGEATADVLPLLGAFDLASLSDRSPVVSANGYGATVTPLDTVYGREDGLWVAATFAYRLPPVEIRSGDRLRFDLATLYPGSYVALASVDVIVADGTRQRVFEARLPPNAGRFVLPRSADVDLDRFRGQTVRLEFGAASANGDHRALWIFYGLPRIVRGG